MKRIVNSIISVILAISMVLCTNLINVNAQERSTQLSKGQYLIINSKKNKLGYFKEGILVKEFSVATGKSSTPTPQGKFKIVNKIKNRPYYSGGIPGGSPNNPLGDRWLGLHVGATYGTTYAIHGNNNASSIGKHVSGGCIRMHNSEIRWLFDQINVGAYAIIDNSDKTFVQIAAKYGIKLAGVESQNIKNLKRAYNEFINYKGIDLLSKDSIITNINDVESILASKYNYINAYNKLNSSEKNNAEVIDDTQKEDGKKEEVICTEEVAVKPVISEKSKFSDCLAHWGTNVGMVTSIRMLGEDGKEKNHFDPYEKIKIQVEFEDNFELDYESFSVAVSIKNKEGTDLCVKTTYDEDVFLKKQKKHCITFEFKTMLAKGEYYLVVALENRENMNPTYYEYIEGAKFFKVFSDKKIFGIYDVDAKITIQ